MLKTNLSAAVLALCFATALSAFSAEETAITQAVAVLHPTAGQKCQGTVRFTQSGNSIKVVADLEGLNPGQKHAFHIHQYGDCTAPDGMSAGGHYNPEGHPHGLPEADKRHAGDLGNIQADDQGKAHYEITVENVTILGHHNPILGRGVIVHAKPDDGGQPVGNAGARIACGVIGVANPGK
jgi:Cu-Zn family superoxide dismutase